MLVRTGLNDLIAKAIDKYVELRSSDAKKVDPRLQELIEALLRRCIEVGEHKQVCQHAHTFSTTYRLFCRPLVSLLKRTVLI